MILLAASILASQQVSVSAIPGQFAPTVESLKQYQTPEWFRDAKFGIWAHWGPQSVPMMGDWYARNMFNQGSGQYEDHLKRWGHPSQHGYREIIDQWKAENWDPAKLMKLYKEAGAKYFVSMGCHHDNFDLWNSKNHSYNAVNMGPKKDIVGMWQREAKRNGMRFGVSEHLGASFTWFQGSHGSDKTGPLAGVPYEGANPTYAELYHTPAQPGDTGWYSNNKEWQKEWFGRVSDLLTNYKPDLLYSDGAMPFGAVGRTLVSNFYNQSIANHGGRLEAVYNCKQGTDSSAFVQDMERGIMPRINPYPWQTDTSIGDWFYNKNWKFRDPDWVIHSLVDIVSKNGNLLINVVQRPDGTIDPEVETLLHNIGDWMKINGESIYGTRPWVTYGEGPTRSGGGNFKEDFSFGAQDVRYVQKGKSTVYATLLGVPTDRNFVFRSLANGTGNIKSVEVLGSKEKPKWTRETDGLHLELPASNAKYSVVVKIKVNDVRAFTPPAEVAVVKAPVKAMADGSFLLGADQAIVDNGGFQVETKDGQSNIGFWDNATDVAKWKLTVALTGEYRVMATVATVHEGASLKVSVGGSSTSGPVPNTGDWAKFKMIELGVIKVAEGAQELHVGCVNEASWKALNLRSVTLIPK